MIIYYKMSSIYETKFWLYLILFYYLAKLCRFVYKNCLRKRKNLKKRYGANSWALITGATDGIGKALAMDLAREGFNIILVSRTLEKLNKVAAEIRNINSNVSTHVIQYDFSILNQLSDYQKAFAYLKDKFDISILINNVGTEQHNNFDRVRLDLVYSTINVNVIPQTILTKIFFNKMNTRPNRSSIINISSYAGDFPFPMKTIYSATKAYNNYVSVGLSEEYKGGNIDFLSVKPLEVETVLSTTKANGFDVITPHQCSNAILNDLGHETVTYGHVNHKIQAFLMRFIPTCVMYPVFRKFWFRIFIKRDEKSE